MIIRSLRHVKQIVMFLLIAQVMYSTVAPNPIWAQNTGLRLSTSPLPINITAAPNTTVTKELRVRNAGSQTESLHVGLLKFSADPITGSPALMAREDGDEYFDWVSFSPSQLTLAPNEWGAVNMTIDIPESAAFGYYYAVTFGRDQEGQPGTGESALVGAAATLVLLAVEVPGAERNIVVESFTAEQAWYEFLPATFQATLRNKGNVHAAPYGTIFIEQNGQQIDQIQLNQAKGNILPESPRTYALTWTNGFPIYKEHEGKQSIEWDFTKVNSLRFGKYTAHLIGAYDDGQRDVPIEASVDFWVIPWRLILPVMVVGLFFIFGVYVFSRGLWRKSRGLNSKSG